MAEASYERQHLVAHAAGWMNSAGTTTLSWGCTLTRIAAGHFALLLDASSGVVDDENFTIVTVKAVTAARLPAVQDLSNTEKRIRVFDNTGAAASGDIEVMINKSVAR
jgi:hypothetical protein